MVVLPSDHYIPDEQKFMDMINNSIKYLMKDEISTFGIGTTRAETGYGYINIDEKSLKNRIYKVKKFVEKPNIKKATEFHNSNNYFWNSGIFIFYSKTILDLAKNIVQIYMI